MSTQSAKRLRWKADGLANGLDDSLGNSLLHKDILGRLGLTCPVQWRVALASTSDFNI